MTDKKNCRNQVGRGIGKKTRKNGCSEKHDTQSTS